MPSVEQFLDDLSTSGLVEEELLATARSTLSSRAVIEEVAADLVRQGILTSYQAEQAVRGKAARLVIGKYVLLEPIGQGGMGRVFKAFHRQMRRTVAMKIVLSPAGSDSLKRSRRFEREAVAAARLDHPNIVGVFDVGQAGKLLYLVMQYVEGRQIRELVKKSGPLPIAQAVDILRQAAEGLAYAHEHGAIHRDVKPSNMMLTHAGVVKILDLGLARLSEETASELTRVGSTLGTIEWMAPEQAADASHVDHRADIYSLGCTLFYLLTGRPVYRGDSPVATLRMHREAPIPSLRELRPDVPAEIDVLYRSMVAKVPDERPSTMRHVLDALKPLPQTTESERMSASEEAPQPEPVRDAPEWSSFEFTPLSESSTVGTKQRSEREAPHQQYTAMNRRRSASNVPFPLAIAGAMLAAFLAWILLVVLTG